MVHGWGVHELAALAAIVRDIFLLVGFVFAGNQLLGAARSRTLNATSMLLDELARTDLRMARHSVLYDLGKPNDVATMNKKDRDLMAFIASTYDASVI